MMQTRTLLLCTTFLLGSCVPITPQPPATVNVYNTITTRTERDVQRTEVVKCVDGGTYNIPDKPSLDDLEDGDDVGVVDRLNEHIDFLRDELKTLAAKGKCNK